jgi:hypothetical protein
LHKPHGSGTAAATRPRRHRHREQASLRPGYERTGGEEFLARLASSVLVTSRVRRDPEDQKALDAGRPDPGPAVDAADLDEVFTRLGLR